MTFNEAIEAISDLNIGSNLYNRFSIIDHFDTFFFFFLFLYYLFIYLNTSYHQLGPRCWLMAVNVCFMYIMMSEI